MIEEELALLASRLGIAIVEGCLALLDPPLDVPEGAQTGAEIDFSVDGHQFHIDLHPGPRVIDGDAEKMARLQALLQARGI